MAATVNYKPTARGAHIFAILCLLSLTLTSFPSPAALSAPAQQAQTYNSYGHFFPETNQASTHTFWRYWNINGGLAQQGYPISEEFMEKSGTDGKDYLVQYYERAVFEFHPTEKPEFRVLLSLLGNFEYKRKYPNGAVNQRPNTSAGSVLFKETGKRLGGIFLDYWRNNGDLAQQGFPISNEFTEKNDLDGKTYTVQYFERAVFEYHPEQKDPKYKVLLSQLGTFQYQRKYQSNLRGLSGDIDGDKIPDKEDLCPKSPENINKVYDDDGCRDSIATLETVALENIDAYWAMVFENTELTNYRSVDEITSCNTEGEFKCPPDEMNNILYYPSNHTIRWHSQFLGEYLDKTDSVTVVIMLAHTWGRLAQGLLHRLDGRYESKALTAQADCYAGAFVTYAEDDGLLEGDMPAAAETLYRLGAESGEGWFDIEQNGTAEERLEAFMNGYSEGPARCDRYTPGSMGW